jgi:predicted RNase H-like nuclease
MRTVMGIDGCRDGWLAIRHGEDGSLEVKVVPKISDVRPLADVVAIDIPIGLPESGPRECDQLARSFIGPRASSVFPAPVRVVLACADYASANALSQERSGKGISQQTFALVPKIREVDEAVRESDLIRERVFEIHPEVSFAAWNRDPLQHAKRSEEGKAQRLALIEEFFGRYAYTFAREFVPRSVVDDDILDAYAATWTSWRIAAGIACSMPKLAPTDIEGLEMAIWY